MFDGQADTGKQLAAINAAVDGKYDAIVMILIDPIQVNEGVKRAIAAKIPVVTLGQPFYTAERKALSQIPDISHDWLKTGELIGDYMIWKSDGKVDALVLNNPETTVVQYGQFAGTKSKLSDPKTCPDCKVTVEDFTIAQINSQPAQLAAAAVQRDPKINWVWRYDFCMANVATDLIARGLQDHISGRASTATPRTSSSSRTARCSACVSPTRATGKRGPPSTPPTASCRLSRSSIRKSRCGCSTRATSRT